MNYYPPINGSIINPPAKLFKRFNYDTLARSSNSYVTFQNEQYYTYFSFRFIESDYKFEKEEQKSKGGATNNNNLVIKFHGAFNPKENSPNEPEENDIVQIENQYWIIEAIKRHRVQCLVNFAIVHLNLKKIELNK